MTRFSTHPIFTDLSGPLDIQVNGYAGIDFNSDDLTETQVISACRSLRDDGIAAVLATVITAPVLAMERRLATMARAIARDSLVKEVLAGFHVEGPFINPEPGYVGAHPAAAVRAADTGIVDRLASAAEGHIALWTLAPEMDAGGRVTSYLTDQHIVVAAGHSNASLSQLQESIDCGMRLYTHLGNGCPGTLPRHDNIIQRVLNVADKIHISLIADGHHLPKFVLANFIRWIPNDRIIIVTDAIAAAGLGPGKYRLADQWVEVDEDLSTWGEGRKNFAGCATTLPQMQRILCQDLGVSLHDYRCWTERNPRSLFNK